MINLLKTSVFFFLAIFLTCFPVLYPQIALGNGKWSGDYQKKPVIEVRYTGLDAFIETGFDEGVIKGKAVYRFEPKHGYVNQIIWAAPGAEINEITNQQGINIPYRTLGDSIIITFSEFLDPDQLSALTIEYQVKPQFGVHFKPNGTIFTSNLPGSVAHWLPGPVHPRVSLPVRLSLEVPGNLIAVATGVPEEQTDTDKGHRFTWNTEGSVPLSETGFAAGDFSVSESFYGTKSLRVYHEKGIITDDERREILSFLVNKTREYERYLRNELPVTSFHAFIGQDNMWETRPYAAGLAFIEKNNESSCLDDLKLQLSRSIAAQWFGIALRTNQWNDSPFMLLIQAMLANGMQDGNWKVNRVPIASAFSVPQTIYSDLSMNQWQWARHFIRQNSDPVMIESLTPGIREFAAMRGVMTSNDFTFRLFEISGRWMNPPDITEPDPEPYRSFKVQVTHENGQTLLNIMPVGDISDKHYNIYVHWISDGSVNNKLIEFHGMGERLKVSTASHVDNVWFEHTKEHEFISDIVKPFPYWLYQLRRDDDPDKRRKAALALKEHTADPDLQLAIQDVINRESNLDVLAALYELMAVLTSGAAGTERRFLEGISNENEQIRKISMRALKAYRGNAQVERQVLAVIQASDDIELVNEAIRTYRHLLDEEPFRDFAIRFLREDRQSLHFTRTLLEQLFELPPDQASVNAAVEYLNDGYSFEIRWLTYQLLRSHSVTDEWQSDFVKRYSDDHDPRIRFIALFSTAGMPVSERESFYHTRMLKEYDLRILNQLKILLPND